MATKTAAKSVKKATKTATKATPKKARGAGLLDGAARQGARDLRRGIPVRVRAPRLPPGRRLRPGGRPRAPGSGGGAPPGLRPRGLGRRRGVHLLRPPRQDADGRAGSATSSGSTARRSVSPRRSRGRPAPCSRGTSATRASTAPTTRSRTSRRAGSSTSRSTGPMDAGVDFIVGETYSWGGEALLALEAIRRSGKPAVITLAVPREGRMREGWSVAEAARRLEAAGADVVGLNCSRGPATMMPLLREIRSAVSCHVAALPVPVPHHAGGAHLPVPHGPELRVHSRQPAVSGRARSLRLQPLRDRRVREGSVRPRRRATWASAAAPGRITCAGLAEGLGRRPPASRYSPDMSKHILFGTDKRLRQDNLEYGLTYRRDPGA